MRKVKLFVGFIALMGLAVLNFTQSESCFVSKALASGGAVGSSTHASDESMWESQWDSYNLSSTSSLGTSGSNSSTGNVVDHGNLADKHCPIWNVQIIIAGGGWAHVCTTGGEYKCFEGPCPHGA